jgi:Tfp pilus assembly protein FimT
MVVIFVFAILVGLAAGNWAAFAKHQKMREEAYAFQKDLMALKATALELGIPIRITYQNNNSYKVDTASAVDAGGNGTSWAQLKPTVPLRSMKITSPNSGLQATTSNGLPYVTSGSNPISSTNTWSTKIDIKPKSLDAFGAANESGYVLLENGNSYYCILKTRNNIKPEIYHKKGANGKWKKI